MTRVKWTFSSLRFTKLMLTHYWRRLSIGPYQRAQSSSNERDTRCLTQSVATFDERIKRKLISVTARYERDWSTEGKSCLEMVTFLLSGEIRIRWIWIHLSWTTSRHRNTSKSVSTRRRPTMKWWMKSTIRYDDPSLIRSWQDCSCFVQVKHLEPWERGSRKTSGLTGMCGGVSFNGLNVSINVIPFRSEVSVAVVLSRLPFVCCINCIRWNSRENKWSV